MPGCITRHKQVLVPVLAACVLLYLDHLFHNYAYSNEAMRLNMAPFIEMQRLTSLGILVKALGVICKIIAVFVLLSCLARKVLAKQSLLEW